MRSNGVLNYDEFINQFITEGSDKWSESVYNEDADFKYISMLQSDNDASNLGQVRGTGEEHLRYFIGNRFPYCDSKWYAGDYPSDYVALRIYTPSTWSGVEPNADITVTPYSHMYAGVRYKANGTLYQKRVEANEVTTFEAPDETFNDTETAIYGASQLSSLGDLSPLYCGSINVANATKLTELIIGSNAEGYSNPNLNDLSVGTNNLLKIINVRNCTKLTDPLGLSGCPNIEEIYASGSAITGIELADSGYVKVIELPATITNLTLKNQAYIETLTLEGYDAIKTIQIENCPTVPSLDILNNATNVERVRLTGVVWSYDTAEEVLELAGRTIGGIDENGINTDRMWIDGTCHIGTLTGAEFAAIKEAFPYLTITYDTLTATLTYMNHDGTETLAAQTIQNGGDGSYSGETPTKESTAQYDFTHSGWSLTPGGDVDPNALKGVEADRVVYAAFTSTVRNYTVNFYVEGVLKESQTIPYGGTATYSGGTPTSSSEYLTFTGWSPEPVGITGDTNCYAQWYDSREIADDWATIAAACMDGTATDKYAIGAYKNAEINYSDGTSETIPFEVVAHNHDELTDGTRKWEKVSTLPFVFDYGRPIVYNNELHILGGAFTSSTSHYKYDGSAWTEVSTLPIANPSGVVLYNNEIHILGGGSVTAHYKYDGSAWTEVSILPYNFSNGTALIFNDEIHILGSNVDTNKHYKYDGSAWTEVSTLPVNHYATPAVVYNNEIHLLGSPASSYTKKHYKYDGAEWTEIGTVPYVTNASDAFVYCNDIHVVGGSNATTAHYKYDGTEWTEASVLPGKSTNGKAIPYNGEIYLLGTSENSTNQKNVWKWSGPSWESVGDMIYWFYGSTSVVYNNTIHTMHESYHYMYDGNEWTTIGSIPYNCAYGYSLVLDGKIHLLAGVKSPTSHYVYDGNEWTEASVLPETNNAYVKPVVYNNELYMFFGEKWYKWNNTEWILCDAKSPVFVLVTIEYNGELYVFGDSEAYKYTGTDFVYVTSMPFHPSNHIPIIYNNEIHFIQRNNGTNHYSFDGITFKQISVLPYKSTSHESVVLFRNKIHIFGHQKKHYVLTNPRATLTFIAKNLLSEDRAIDGPAISLGSAQKRNEWSTTYTRTWLNETLLSKLPSDLQNIISKVIKISDYRAAGVNGLVKTEESIWIPSVDEVGLTGTDHLSGQGKAYSVFTDNPSRIATKYGELEGYNYWLRSSRSQTQTYYVHSGGWIAYAIISSDCKYGIRIGFCI